MVDIWLETLLQGKCIPENDLISLCEMTKLLLMEENNVQPVQSPVVVCGNINGQFFDLLELFRRGGDLPYTSYVFLGGYVNLGFHSVETFEMLMALKVKYPRRMVMLRGNHEARQLTQVYGFYDECMRKYGNSTPWKHFTSVFDYLSLAAIIDESLLCVHAGLSPSLHTIDQIRVLTRNQEIPSTGPFCDLVWSDPDDIEAWMVSPRGAGWLYGASVTHKFRHINRLELICRSHQLEQEGYKYWFRDKDLVTVWSAPNYCYRCGNPGAMLNIAEDGRRDFMKFYAAAESGNSGNHSNKFPFFP